MSEEPGFSPELLASPYYHSPLKNCRIQNVGSSYNKQIDTKYTKQKCLTHKVIIGRSGWELGQWGNTPSVNYKDRQALHYVCISDHHFYQVEAYRCPTCNSDDLDIVK